MASFVDAATPAANLWSARQIAVEVDGLEGGPLSILVDKPFARVGRDQRAEVPLSDGRLFPCHLYLHATEEGVYYAGLLPGTPSGWLLPSESVQVGPFHLRARLVEATRGEPLLDDLQAKQSLSAVPELRVFNGRQGRSTDLRLRRRLTLLGREPPATRRINHPTISRVHCAIFFDGRELWLVDLFSSNGTQVAGNKFDSGLLAAGQELKLGSVRFRYLGTATNQGAEAEGSALEQPVKILDHSDDADPHDAESRPAAWEEREPALAEALRQQNARLEQERGEFQHQLEGRLAAIREELVKEVEALRQESAIAGQAFQSLSGEVAATREALFAFYAEVGPRLAEAGDAASADDEQAQIAAALQKAETRWTELAEDLPRRILELGRQIDDAQAAHHALAGSIKLERDETKKRLRKERRASRQRLAAEKRKLAPEIAALQEQADAVRQDLRSLEVAVARIEPTASAEHDQHAGGHNQALAEAMQRHDEALCLAEARWKDLTDGLERRVSELAQGVADCRQADNQMAESFKAALREAARQLQAQHQAQSLEVASVKDEFGSGTSALAGQIAALREQLERHAADFAPLKQTLAAVQPTLTRLESGEWAAELQTRWRAHLEKAFDEVRERIADIARQSALERQAASDRVAVLEGALTAKIADLRGGLDLMRETAKEQRCELRATVAGGELLPRQAAAPVPAVPQSLLPPSGLATSDPDSRQPGQTYENAESAAPPQWVINDEMTDRLLDFKTNREQTVRWRRLLWTAVAAGLVAIIVSGAGILRLWLSGSEAINQNEAASLEQSRLANR